MERCIASPERRTHELTVHTSLTLMRSKFFPLSVLFVRGNALQVGYKGRAWGRNYGNQLLRFPSYRQLCSKQEAAPWHSWFIILALDACVAMTPSETGRTTRTTQVPGGCFYVTGGMSHWWIFNLGISMSCMSAAVQQLSCLLFPKGMSYNIGCVQTNNTLPKEKLRLMENWIPLMDCFAVCSMPSHSPFTKKLQRTASRK